jgi:hypothetical protein
MLGGEPPLLVTATGAIDGTFTFPDTATGGLTIDPLGRVVYSSWVYGASSTITRLLPTGAADETFGTKGTVELTCPGGFGSGSVERVFGEADVLFVLTTCGVSQTSYDTRGALVALDMVHGTPIDTLGSAGWVFLGPEYSTSSGPFVRSASGFVQSDGRVVVLYEFVFDGKGGWVSTNGFVKRYNALLQDDATFGNLGNVELNLRLPELYSARLITYDSLANRAVVVGTDQHSQVFVARIWL